MQTNHSLYSKHFTWQIVKFLSSAACDVSVSVAPWRHDTHARPGSYGQQPAVSFQCQSCVGCRGANITRQVSQGAAVQTSHLNTTANTHGGNSRGFTLVEH